MQKLKLRRLYDIQTDHVSLVDRAANMKSFLIVKRNENQKGDTDMEVVEALLKIENALNDLSSRVEKFEGKEVKFSFDTTELEKRGARFSKETIASLQSIKQSIESLLGTMEEEKDDDVSTDAAVNAITKGIQAAFVKDEKKLDETELSKKIVTALAEALKSVRE